MNNHETMRTLSYEDVEEETRYIQQQDESKEDLETYDDEMDYQPSHDELDNEDEQDDESYIP